MEVKLIGHTQLTKSFYNSFNRHKSLTLEHDGNELDDFGVSDGQVVALTAIRTCYSHNKPSEIVELEGGKYFGQKATEGEGSEADRLIRHIMNSGHTSTMEHLNFTFAIEGVSRSLLTQLTRHRHFSYSVQSQRYVKLESDSKSGGFDYAVPNSIEEMALPNTEGVWAKYHGFMSKAQELYNDLRKSGVPAEDARYILPNATTCNLVLTGNLRSLLDFYSKRNPTTHAQWEIQELAEKLKTAVVEVEPWTAAFF